MHKKMELSPKKATVIVFLTTFMNSLLGFGVDLYSPSFPTMATFFKTTNQLIQLTISVYFFGYCLGLLTLGPLMDSWGRKKPILFGIAFFVLTSFLSGFAQNIETLLLLRGCQGFGISVVGTGVIAILGDVFTDKKLAKSMAMASMSYRVGPIVAPFIGGFLEVYLGWPSNFFFLTLLALLILLCVITLLPETHFDLHPFHIKKIVHAYWHILKTPVFLGAGICVGLYYSMMIIFNVIGPFFIQDVLGYSPIAYGYLALLVGIIAFFGIMTNRILLHHHSTETIIRIGVYIVLGIEVLQAICSLFFPVSIFVFISFVMVTLFFSGFMTSNMLSQVFNKTPFAKGTAAALFAILMMGFTGLLTALSSFLKSSTIRPFAFCYLALAFLGFCSYQFIFRKGLK